MKHFPFILALVVTLFGSLVFIAGAQNYVPLAPLPGTFTGTEAAPKTDMTTYLSGAIKLLLAIGASLAILMTVIGGTQYVAAGISPDAKSKAKDMVTNSFIGLALMLVSYLILNSINPKLVQFNLSLEKTKMNVAELTVDEGVITTAIGGTVKATSILGCKYALDAGIKCLPCDDCTKIPDDIENKQKTLLGKSPDGNFYLQKDVLAKVIKLNESFPSASFGWRITESWPPTSDHVSACHQNGGCLDINNSFGQTDPSTILTYYKAFKSAGLGVLYETRKGCEPYVVVGVKKCGVYPTMTNDSSFHIRGTPYPNQ